MAQIIQPYEVSITSVDVSPQEVLLDLFHSLERLSGTVDDIFGKVEKRVMDERNRINQINSRVDACKKVVDSIRGKQTATTIFSTAKFPAPKKLPAYPTLLSQVANMPDPHRDVEDDVAYYPPSAKQSVVGNAEATEESLLLLSRLNAHGSDLERVEFTMEDEGLGTFPTQIEYVGSLLLFNTKINPYKEYQSLDNFMSTGKQKDDEIAAAKGLAAAPTSILSGDALPDIEGLDLNFKPQMGVMSNLSLPDNLPLDFVATNLNYRGAELPSIAPSAQKPNYDLPQITYGGYDAGPTAKEVYIPDIPDVPSSAGAAPAAGGDAATKSAPPPPPPPTAAVAPPPPPPPMSVNAHPPPDATPAAAMPPVPQVPVPPVPAQLDVADDDNDDGEAAPVPSGGGGGYVNPLDAIKGMSVSKLRKVAESDVAAMKKEKQEHEQAKPKSMMEEMRAKMQRRNSAISGKDQKSAGRRESLVIQQAQSAAALSTAAPDKPKPAPPSTDAPRPKSSNLLKMGFSSIDAVKEEDGDSDDSEPPMASRAVAFAADSDFSSDDSSISDVSDVSFAPPPALAPKAVPALPKLNADPAPVSPSAASPAPAPAPVPAASHRGSLLEGGNPHMDSMLSASKAKVIKDASDSEDDDWD
jgi:hypothetical protein